MRFWRWRRWPRPRRRRRWPLRLAVAVVVLVALSVLLVLPLRWLDPTTTAFMLQDDSGRVPVLFEWVSWDELGAAAALAVVAAEDQKFVDHSGLDVDSIVDSIHEARDGGRLRGASTISQQVTKNLFLWSGRSWARKGLEAYLTMVAEVCLPKRRLLEIYLNIVELGPGIYGVGAASDFYFGKSPAALNDAEAALLAAVLPNPHAMRVDRPSAYVRERQRWILTHMRRLRREGWLTRL